MKVKGAFLTELKGKTATKKCLVIPTDSNELFVGEKGIYISFSAIEMKEKKFDNTHFIKVQLNSEDYKKLSEEERKAIPIVGGMKAIPERESTIPVSNAEVSSPFDDLPF